MKRCLALTAAAGVLGFGAFDAAAAEAYVYWGENSGGEIARADNDGSGVNDSFVAASTPEGIAVDSSYVYWGSGGIGRANLNGTDVQPSWIPDLGSGVTSIATDGTYIYWTATTPYIGRALLDGTDVTPDFIKASAAVDSVTVASGTIFYGAGADIYTVLPSDPKSSGLFLTVPGAAGTTVQDLAAADGYLYWSAVTLGSGSKIGAVPDNNPTMDNPSLVSSSGFIPGIATDGTHLYWSKVASALGGGPGEVYRGTLNGGTAITGTPQVFAMDSNSPAGVAVDAGIDPTTTTVSCAPATVATGQPSACTATVSDSASPSIPTGAVTFSGSGGAFFTGGPCQLAPAAGGASCAVGANLTTAGSQSITATYAGDTVHSSSSGEATVCSGSATQCGGGSKPPPPPPPPPPSCVVPKLKHKSLSAARSALTKAHCRLGKVTKPRRRKHHKQPKLVVSSSKPASGTKLANDAKVALKLTPAPKRRRHKRHR